MKKGRFSRNFRFGYVNHKREIDENLKKNRFSVVSMGVKNSFMLKILEFIERNLVENDEKRLFCKK